MSDSRFRDALDAWHGSYADFDEFRDDKINTGEGAQVYGHGHYVGEAKGTGEEYRDSVSRKRGLAKGYYFDRDPAYGPISIGQLVAHQNAGNITRVWQTLHQVQGHGSLPNLSNHDKDHLMMILGQAHDQYSDQGPTPRHLLDHAKDMHEDVLSDGPFNPDDEEHVESKQFLDSYPVLDKWIDAIKEAVGGRLYQLKVDLSEPHVLDWDNTLADHHPESQARLKDHLGQLKSGTDVSGFNVYAKGYTDRSDALGVKLDESMSGQKLYGYLKNMHGDAPAASEALRKTGIHGIRYLDQFSRQKWSDWKNQVKPYDVTTVHGLVDKSGKADPKQIEEINKDIYDQSNVFGVKPRTLEDLISHIAREKLNHLSFSSTADYVQKEIVKYHKMLNWIAENQRNLDIHVETKRVTPSAEKPKDLTYNYVVFDPKLIKMVRKYDDRGNVVHDYTQASGTELRPVNHDPFAEEKK